MIDSRRRLLTEALGECWHEIERYTKGTHVPVCTCGAWECRKDNRTFAKPDDYDALREKVIVPNIIEFMTWMDAYDSGLFHWLTLSPEERNEIICDFGIACLGWEVHE